MNEQLFSENFESLLRRYNRIQLITESKRTIDDIAFLENFKAAISIWGMKKAVTNNLETIDRH